MYKLRIIVSISILFAVNSCTPSFDDPRYNTGTADFTSYVALGNSFTAGFADAALYVEGQENAYPAMLARQFMMVGNSGEFHTPLLDAANAIGGVNPSASTDPLQTTTKFILGYATGCDGVTTLTPVPYGPPNTQNNSYLQNIFASMGPFNNLGVPGIKSFHLDNPDVALLSPTNKNYNPFYARMASDPQFSTILGDAQLVNPTFFTLWIGSNDVLGYATSGGISPVSAGMNWVDISPIDTFKLALTNAVNKLLATGAKGAVGNIPDITDIPFFTSIPYNGLNLTRQGQVDTLNNLYASLGIIFHLGQNAYVVADSFAPGGVRQIQAAELILLTIPQEEIRCNGMGSTTPIPDKYWLDQDEMDLIRNITIAFNNHISSLVNNYPDKLALVNFNAYFNNLTAGIIFNGVTYTPEFISGGAFSLDGIHPNQRGYALIANQYIAVINATFGSTIPQVDVNKFPGIVFP